MGSFTAISDAGNSFVKLLRDKLTPNPILKPELIGLCSPAEKGDLRLTVFPYSIKENGAWRSPNGQNLSLSIYFLLIAYSTVEISSRAYDELCILGAAMKVIAMNQVLKGSYLCGTLAERNEELKIILNNMTPEEQSKIWTFPNVAFKTSLCYIVEPVLIDINEISDFTAIKRVT